MIENQILSGAINLGTSYLYVCLIVVCHHILEHEKYLGIFLIKNLI